MAHLAEVHGLPHRHAVARGSDALWQVGLGEERFRALGTMSTGQKQRVKLAAALAHDPHLLLLDEPTDGLDPVQRDDMLTLVRRIGTEYGIDVVLSSHLLDEVERVCDAAVILGEGRVLASGPLDSLRARVGGWHVEVEGSTEALEAALRAAGAEVRAEGVRLRVEGIATGRAHPRCRGTARARAGPAATATPVVGRRVPRSRGVRQPERRRLMSDARIFDRGYRPYTGPRLGPAGAVRSLVKATAQRVMGIKRPARAKVLPVAAAIIAYVPALVFIGVAALIDDPRTRRNVIPSYGEYYGFIISALIVFTAFVAPEALCPDRRTGMLGLYLASPLTRGRYLAAKVAAVLGLLAVATLGPPLLMLVSFVLQDLGPDGPVEVVKLLARILLAGSLVAGVYGAVSLGVSSLTDRKAFAAGAVLLLLLVTGAITGALVDGLDAPQWLLAFNLAVSPLELVQRIYGERGELDDTSTALLFAVNIGWIVTGFSVLWWQYRRLVVTR